MRYAASPARPPARRRVAPPPSARARASAAAARSGASSSPRPCGRRAARRGRAAGPRESRRPARAEAAVGRAEEREELAAGRRCCHAKRSSESSAWPNAVDAQPRTRLDRERDAERAEGRLQRGARALERRADDRDLFRRPSRRGRGRAPSSATSSSVARRPAPSRNRIEPSSGPRAESSSKSPRSSRASPGGR